MSMDLSRPATAGTDFTTLTTVPLLASFLTAAAALATAAFVLSGTANGVTSVVLPRRVPERVVAGRPPSSCARSRNWTT